MPSQAPGMEANPYQSPSADPLGTNTAAAVGVTPRTISELAGTRPWVRLLAVLGILSSVVMLLIGAANIVMGALGASGGNSAFAEIGMAGGPILIIGGVFYLLIGFLYLFPSIKLWKFGSSIRQLQLTHGVEDLEAAIAQQRGFWKFTGIMAILGIVLVILMIIGTIVFGAAMASQAGGGFEIPN